ncbi:DNA-binding protein [Streptomyces sp. NRRL F-5630]|uniref:DNA-binding protein n=1 Tax=unclassified Streptomyces TaxID=2593676 RepID=UPI00068A6D53|nr:DNA-binding protein [Streptomyces sp. NRRL F-5630]
MTPLIATRAPITPLQPALQRIAQHLVDGLTTCEIATRTGLTVGTIRQYIRDIRDSVHCPPRCKPQVLVHLLLVAEQVALPTSDRPTPELNAEQLLLLRAVAEHSDSSDVALAARLAPADVRSAIDQLLDETGAADVTQLVVLAHAWGLLGTWPATGQPATTAPRPRSPAP